MPIFNANIVAKRRYSWLGNLVKEFSDHLSQQAHSFRSQNTDSVHNELHL